MIFESIDDFRKMKRLTIKKPDGSWGIDGVDLSTLSPKVYAALMKLHDLEDALAGDAAGASPCPTWDEISKAVASSPAPSDHVHLFNRRIERR